MLKQRTWKKWTDEDRETLKKLAGKYPPQEIAAKMGRSYESLNTEATNLKISLRCKKCDRTRKNWTNDEEVLLESLAGELPPRMIAERMRRPVEGIYRKATKMRISLVLETDNWSARQFAELLGVDDTTVNQWIRKKWLVAHKVPHNRRYHISRQNFKDFYANYQQKCPSLKKIDPEILEFVLND
jgi:excisionase family DNA binding protein